MATKHPRKNTKLYLHMEREKASVQEEVREERCPAEKRGSKLLLSVEPEMVISAPWANMMKIKIPDPYPKHTC